VGWSVNFDTRGISDGDHTLQVTATSSSGRRSTVDAPFRVSNADSANPLRLVIDSPNSASGGLTGVTDIYGWALDDAGVIQQLNFYIDSVFVTSTLRSLAPFNPALPRYGVSRTDVCAAYPGRASCPNVGWRYSLDTNQYGNGPHTLTVSTTTISGHAATASAVFQVNNDPNTVINGPLRMVFDGPAPEKGPLSGTVSFYGWAIDDQSPIHNAGFAVDGIWIGSGTYGAQRPDVCAAFVDHLNCPNAGWSFALDTAKYANGRHSISVLVFADRGPGTAYLTKTYEFANSSGSPSTKLAIDQPSGGSPLAGTVTASGWALDDSAAIARVSYAIDGMLNAANSFQLGVSYGWIRADVCAVYPNRPRCPNVGWTR